MPQLKLWIFSTIFIIMASQQSYAMIKTPAANIIEVTESTESLDPSDPRPLRIQKAIPLPNLVSSQPSTMDASTQTELRQQGGHLYFRLSDDSIESCPEIDFLTYVGTSSNFFSGALSGVFANTGRTRENPISLSIPSRYFRDYVLPLFLTGTVALEKQKNGNTVIHNLNSHLEKLGIKVGRNPRYKKLFVLQIVNNELDAKPSITCPEGFIPVPGNPLYKTPEAGNDFCVMKYATSKDGTGKAVSAKNKMPWVNINNDEAAQACKALGSDYALMSNNHWMVIARNIEENPVNWNNGTGPVGTGTLSRGNSDSRAVAAPSDDETPYIGTGFNGDWTHKRTHTLSNGEIIWDMAGNVWQWTIIPIKGNHAVTSSNNRWIEYNDFTEFPMPSNSGPRHLFAPNGNYSLKQNVGAAYMESVDAIVRGGTSNNSIYAGVFATILGFNSTLKNDFLGFRCIYSPQK